LLYQALPLKALQFALDLVSGASKKVIFRLTGCRQAFRKTTGNDAKHTGNKNDSPDA
jgi:hypothetical protein